MKENELDARYLSKSELSVLLITLVSIGIGTSLTGGWILTEIFFALEPLLYLSLPGYFLVIYTNRNGEKFKRAWLRNGLAILGAILIATGLMGTLFFMFSPWVAWILLGVVGLYFFNR